MGLKTNNILFLLMKLLIEFNSDSFMVCVKGISVIYRKEKNNNPKINLRKVKLKSCNKKNEAIADKAEDEKILSVDFQLIVTPIKRLAKKNP